MRFTFDVYALQMIRKPLLMSIDHSAEGDEIRVLTPDQNHGDVRLAVLQLIEVFEVASYTCFFFLSHLHFMGFKGSAVKVFLRF